VARLGSVRFRHAAGVAAVTFSPDGSTLASASRAWESSIRLWEATTGRPLRRLTGHSRDVLDVAFSPDGRLLASAGQDKTLRFWDTATGRELSRTSLPEPVACLAFSPDGGRIASGGDPDAIRLWEPGGARELGRLDTQGNSVTDLAFSPDGRLLAACCWDSRLRVWDVESGRLIQEMKGHKGMPTSLAFSPDGERLASSAGTLGTSYSSFDTAVRVWRVRTGEQLACLQKHDRGVEEVAFSPDGRLLASAGCDRVIQLWDTATYQPVRTLAGHSDEVQCLAFSPDGRVLASGDTGHALRLWRVEDGQALAPHEAQDEQHDSRVAGVSLSVRGVLASAAHDGSVRLWDLDSGRLLHRLSGHRSSALCVAFSPDGTLLASGGLDDKLLLWDAATGGRTGSIQLGADVSSLAFSPDGRLLAAGGSTGVLWVWSLEDEEMLHEFGGDQPISSVAFSPDGAFLAIAHSSHGLRVMQCRGESVSELWESPVSRDAPHIRAIAFSPKTGFLAAACSSPAGEGGCIQFWEVSTWREPCAPGAPGAIHDPYMGDSSRQCSSVRELEDWRLERARADSCLAFSPGGKWLASAGHEGVIHLWDVHLGKEHRVLEGHEGLVTSLCFSADGRELISGSWDTTVLVWDVSSARSQQEARGLATVEARPTVPERPQAPKAYAGLGLRTLIRSMEEREPPRSHYHLTHGLQLLQVPDEERGVSRKVLERLDGFLGKQRRKTKSPHSLATELAAVLGQQLKKSGWRWVEISWKEASPLPPLKGMDPNGQDPGHWGLVSGDGAFLVLPIHDLLWVLVHTNLPVTFARRVTALLGRTGTRDALEWVRLSHG
jgi:WD40 repeat protein